jgi:hypothetical protein
MPSQSDATMWHTRGNGRSVVRREVLVRIWNFVDVDDFDLRVNSLWFVTPSFPVILFAKLQVWVWEINVQPLI